MLIVFFDKLLVIFKIFIANYLMEIIINAKNSTGNADAQI